MNINPRGCPRKDRSGSAGPAGEGEDELKPVSLAGLLVAATNYFAASQLGGKSRNPRGDYAIPQRPQPEIRAIALDGARAVINVEVN
jgi:hypothetical protein